MTFFKKRLNLFLYLVMFFLLLGAALPVAAQVPASKHVFLIMEENTSYSSVVNTASSTTYMPWLVSQGNLYGHATNYLTNNAGSLLAYLWVSSGSCENSARCTLPPGTNNFGCGGGSCTSTITDDNIYREMAKAGKSWRLYAEDIPSTGYTGLGQTVCPDPYCQYDPHHNGPIHYSDIINSTTQANNMVDFSQFTTDMNAGTLPQYSFIIPNNLHDAHDASPAQADLWLQNNIAPLLSQPYFQPCGDGILIITFDNDDLDQSGLVYTAVIGPKVIPHFVSNVRYQHQNALRTMLDALGITTYPGDSATAIPMKDFFGAPSACPVLSTTALSYGDQTLNTNTSKTVTLTNNGNAAMSITSIIATGDYSQTNNCGVSLAAGASCTTTVTFKPTVLGIRNGTLTFKDSAPSGSQVVTLTGNGVSPAPVVSLSPSSLNFGNQNVGTSTTQVETLTNTGTGALSITSIAATGDYTQTNNCGTSLAAGASCTTNVTFTPSAGGARAGTLTYTDSAAGSPHVVNLTGTGVSIVSSNTYVSTLGVDTNVCSRPSPCLTFAGALAKTSAGGEIDVIDPGEYGPITINKSVTIDGGGGLTAGIVTGGNGYAIVINASNVNITLRNLDITGATIGFSGITVGPGVTGVTLHVEKCVITSFAGIGIDFEPGAGGQANQLLVTRTSVRNNVKGGILIANAKAALNAVASARNSFGVKAIDGAIVEVRRGSAGGNTSQGYAAQSSGGAVQLSIVDSISAANGGNGIDSAVVSGGSAIIRLSNVTVTENTGTGLANSGGGQILSLSRNGQGTNNISGNIGGNGAPTGVFARR